MDQLPRKIGLISTRMWIITLLLLTGMTIPVNGQQDFEVTITCDNAYMFGFGDVNGIFNGSLFGGVINRYSDEIFSSRIWDVSAHGGSLPSSGQFPYYGPERYSINIKIAGKYLYIIAWSDNMRYQGTIATFEDTFTRYRYVTGPGSGWEVYATGIDLNIRESNLPKLADLNTQITIANGKSGGTPGSIGWVKEKGCSNESTGCRGSILYCQQFTDEMYALNPGIQQIFGEAEFMWYYNPDFPAGGCDYPINEANLSGEYLIFRLGPLDEFIPQVCDIGAPVTLTAHSIEAKETVQLQTTHRNISMNPETVERIDLTISPEAGVIPLDPLSQPGGTLFPDDIMNRHWDLRALVQRELRTAHFEVTAYGTEDSVLSVCTHDLYIPGIDGLHCAIAAPDSVRFDRSSVTYKPALVPVRMTLQNILDTHETAIEAELVLTEATRLCLAPGHSAQQNLSRIESDMGAIFEWPLVALHGDIDETQDIVIRYRSVEQSVWKICNVSIVVEAWPRELTTRCLVAGHDSLYFDAEYEMLLPEPFEISYTATNAGTVALTNCAASIVLPSAFELVSGSATRSYGTLNPGQSAIQWWTLRTNSALSDYGSYPISWTWNSLEQGSTAGCEHRVHVLSNPSRGLLFTPLHLYFEAVPHAALPEPQYVELWTGGAASMPWTAQSSATWLIADPVAGDRAARIAVQPSTTELPIGLFVTVLTIAETSPNLPKDVAVIYRITGTVSVQDDATPVTFGLGPVWPQPVSMNSVACIRIDNPSGEFVRLSIYDALGREVVVLHEGPVSEQDNIIRFIPTADRFLHGLYFLRLISTTDHAVRGVLVH